MVPVWKRLLVRDGVGRGTNSCMSANPTESGIPFLHLCTTYFIPLAIIFIVFY